jgi:hypothetical protein
MQLFLVFVETRNRYRGTSFPGLLATRHIVVGLREAWHKQTNLQRWTGHPRPLPPARCITWDGQALTWGGHAEMVTDPEEILPAIQRAAANGKPSIINVEVDKKFGIFKQR